MYVQVTDDITPHTQYPANAIILSRPKYYHISVISYATCGTSFRPFRYDDGSPHVVPTRATRGVKSAAIKILLDGKERPSKVSGPHVPFRPASPPCAPLRRHPPRPHHHSPCPNPLRSVICTTTEMYRPHPGIFPGTGKGARAVPSYSGCDFRLVTPRLVPMKCQDNAFGSGRSFFAQATGKGLVSSNPCPKTAASHPVPSSPCKTISTNHLTQNSVKCSVLWRQISTAV